MDESMRAVTGYGDRYEDMLAYWRERLRLDLPDQSDATREPIVQWLVGEAERFEPMALKEIRLAKKAMDYRYRIFMSRYWGLSPDRAYKRLLQKLGGLFLIRSKIRVWIALSRDRKRAVKDVLQEVIQEMLQSDRHMRAQTEWIGQCTPRVSLRSLLTLATIEEYCLRPIRNQPLLVYRFVNYLRRSQRGGMTQVPSAELIRLISEEIGTDDADGTLSLLDFEALDRYEVQKEYEAQAAARQLVKQQFADYLNDTLGDTAVQWLELHLQGYAQDSISRQLGLNVREAYRLREKISYHAIRIFTLKQQPDLVFSWLKTSLKQHNLGLTLTEWDQYWEKLSAPQQTMLNAFKSGRSVDEIAQTCELTPKQVSSQWAELYLLAQETRMSKES
ncbi:MAG: HetZ-related protein 2 [Phormidesmis sp.]